jgi:hypothetical protein
MMFCPLRLVPKVHRMHGWGCVVVLAPKRRHIALAENELETPSAQHVHFRLLLFKEMHMKSTT